MPHQLATDGGVADEAWHWPKRVSFVAVFSVMLHGYMCDCLVQAHTTV